MRSIGRNDSCPCGTGLKFKKCCGPALDNITWPESPEALMRSRFSAFVTGAVDHLYRTTHPDNQEMQGSDRERYRQETLAFCRNVDFTGLTVHQTWPEDAQGEGRVKFTAAYTTDGAAHTTTELSVFVRPNGNWVYLRDEAE